MAEDARLVDNSNVMAGGVTTANIPAAARKLRRSVAALVVSSSAPIKDSSRLASRPLDSVVL
jgi:hypothetical protein